MLKQRLYTPGPVETPPQVLAAATEMVHHRSGAFTELFMHIRTQLAHIAQVPDDDVLILATTGSAAFEAGLLACVPKGSKVIGINAGKFGERWCKVAATYGYEVIELTLPWGHVASAEAVVALVEQHPDAKALMSTHSETSTGALHDIATITQAVHEIHPELLVLVDCVTSLGVSPVDPWQWGIDGMFSGSQKGLLTPPGLAFAWLSERAWASDEGLNPSFYLDLRKERAAQKKGQTAYTAAVTLIRSLGVALDMLLEEGLEQVWARRERLNRAVLVAGKALGCEGYAQRVSPAVAAMRAPKGLAAPEIVKGFAARGMTIAGGQDQAKPELFRPSLMGYADSYDAVMVAAALEDVLTSLGHVCLEARGVLAALQVLREYGNDTSTQKPI